tara:strand:- start:11547 stop:13877 length:2331 start_codon:yes stop_codon:yes gene_type:complete
MAERRKPGAVNPNKYSIYAARDAQRSNVDWGKIAGDLTNTIGTIVADRKMRKAAIEAQTQKDIEKLSEVQDIGNQDAMSLLLRASNMTKDSLLVQQDLMRRGLTKPEDFQLFSQSTKTGYANLSKATKNYDTWYQKAMAAVEDGSASSIEQFANNSTSSFGNLKDKMLWTNPNNGQLQLVSMGQDEEGNYNQMPDPKKNPEYFMNPNSMNARMQYKNKTRILKDEVNNIVEPLAEFIRSSRGKDRGEVITREDFRKFGKFGEGETYETWLEDQIDLLTVDPNNATQILTDNGYKIANTLKEFKRDNPGLDEKFFIKGDTTSGTVVLSLSDEQEDRAEDLAEAAIETAIGFKQQAQGSPTPPNKYQDEKTDEENRLIGFMDDVDNLVSGTEDEYRATARDRIVSLNNIARGKNGSGRLIDSINRTDKEMIITYQDGTVEQPIDRFNEDGSIKDGATISKELWRYVTNEDESSFKKARDLFEAEKDGGFTDTGIDETSEQTTARVLNQRATDRLVDDRLKKAGKINPTEKERAEEREKLLESANGPDLIAKAIVEETTAIEGTDEGAKEALKAAGNANPTPEEIKKAKQTITSENKKEIAALKKRILRGKKADQYSSLPPTGNLPSSSDPVVEGLDKLGAPTIMSGTEYLDDAFGGNIGYTNKDSTIQEASNKVLNSYLPTELTGGARVVYDRGDTGNNVLEIEYYDANGKIQVIKRQTSQSPGSRTTPQELNQMIYEAAEFIKQNEDKTRETRYKKGVRKKGKKFKGGQKESGGELD